MEMMDRKKRFYNDLNSKKFKSEEELITRIVTMHNFNRAGGEEVILTCQYQIQQANNKNPGSP
jgi:hypothetical protein